MTRKDALLLAIQELSKKKKTAEAALILQEMYDEMPIHKWTQASALDAINQYIIDHDNVFPTDRDFGKGILPSRNGCRELFQIKSFTEFREEYFPYATLYSDWEKARLSEEDYLNIFKDNYLRIREGKYVPRKVYDARREAGSPSTATLFAKTGCKNYDELIELSGVRNFKKNPLILKGVTHAELSLDEAKALGEKLAAFMEGLEEELECASNA